MGLTGLDGDGRADLVVAASGSDTVGSVAYLLRGTAGGPSTAGVTRLSGDTFDDTEGPVLLMGGGAVAHLALSALSAVRCRTRTDLDGS
ncbi:hypothetical protein [Streptomyces flaveolus]|uniref:hypothetical protein n=1 Tax=Streptomyces flaveolus TaxID=67297 RepID=UPI0033D31127